MVETAVLEAETREPLAPAAVEENAGVQNFRRLDSIEASSHERSDRNEAQSGDGADAERVHHAKIERVCVVVIDPATYPHFAADRDHPFIGMEAAERLKKFVACCAQLWARACHEQARATKRPAA